MIGQSGVKNFSYLLMLGEEVGYNASAAVMDLHAGCESLHAAQDQPAFKGRHDRPGTLLQVRQLVRVLLVLADDNSAKSVAVTVKKLCGRVHDHVCAERERLLEIRGHECVVDNKPDLLATADFADRIQVTDAHQRIRGSLDVDHARVFAN